MQRYHVAANCSWPTSDGEYVLHSEAQAEIARLQAELNLMRDKFGEFLLARRELNTVYVPNPTACSDALEEAAKISDYYADADYCAMGYTEDAGIAASGTARTIGAEIRTLKRKPGDQQ